MDAIDHAAILRAQLRHRSNITPAMLHSIDGQGLIVSVSDAWLSRLGYARDEVIGRPSIGFLTPESRERAERGDLRAFFTTGRTDNLEIQMVCKDGSTIDVLLSAVLDDSPGEQGTISLSVITDVTALKQAERRLAESEARYRGLVEDQSELVCLATPEGELRFVNHAYARHYGLMPEQMVGRNLYDDIPEDERATVAAHLAHVCRAGGIFESQNQVVLGDGRVRWMAWTNRAITDAQGRVTAIQSVGRDIEDQMRAEEKLKESEARYRLLAENSSDMVFQLDAQLVRRYVSPACREILGYAPEELVGRKPVAMVHPDDAPHVHAALVSLLAGQSARQTVVNRVGHRDGRWVWVEAELRALLDASGIIGSLRDVSARKAVEDRLAEASRRLAVLAAQDALTGLRNRRAFDEALDNEFRRASRERLGLALLMIDVDWFKAYNDQYGHPAGDACLRQVGQAIAGAIGRAGDISARYGGEEFVVLLPDTDDLGAMVIAERIRDTVRGLGIAHLGSGIGVVTVSIGAASTGGQGENEGPAGLLKAADKALYQAKALGRNAVVRAERK